MSDTSDNAENIAKQSLNEVKKSGEDWLKYVETHPIQTMFFGLVAYFAMKGLAK